MKRIILIVLIASCKPGDQKISFSDSLKKQRYIDSTVDAQMNESLNTVMWDTSGLATAPIIVKSARTVSREYSSYRDVHLTYKNVSNKKITAIRFRWYGENAFGEPADLGNLTVRGFGGGFTDESLSPNESSEGTWNVLSKDARKIIKAWPIEVAFSDGTKWKVAN